MLIESAYDKLIILHGASGARYRIIERETKEDGYR